MSYVILADLVLALALFASCNFIKDDNLGVLVMGWALTFSSPLIGIAMLALLLYVQITETLAFAWEHLRPSPSPQSRGWKRPAAKPETKWSRP